MWKCQHQCIVVFLLHCWLSSVLFHGTSDKIQIYTMTRVILHMLTFNPTFHSYFTLISPLCTSLLNALSFLVSFSGGFLQRHTIIIPWEPTVHTGQEISGLNSELQLSLLSSKTIPTLTSSSVADICCSLPSSLLPKPRDKADLFQ